MKFFAWAIALAILGLFAIIYGQTIWLISHEPRVFAAKKGNVIDSQDGQALPNVYVIAVASADWETLLGSGSSRVLYRHVAKTDSNGQYTLPSDWFSASLWFPPLMGMHTNIEWSITAFRLGYAIDTDDAGPSLGHTGPSLPMPPSIQNPPSGVLQSSVMQVDTIKMSPVNLDEQQMATYYAAIIAPRTNPTREISSQPDEIAMRRQVYEALAPRLCNLPRDLVIAWSIAPFVKDPNGFGDKLAALEPAAFRRALQLGAAPAVHAGSECDLMKSEAGGAPQ